MALIDRAYKAAVGVLTGSGPGSGRGLLQGVFPGSVGTPPKRGTQEFLLAYSKMPWLRAVSNKIASAIASTEWKVYVTTSGPEKKATRDRTLQRAATPWRRKELLQERRKQGKLRELDNHPLLDFIDSTNPYLTGLSTRKVTQLHLDIVGEAFWIKERNGYGMPIQAWPAPPHWIMNTPTLTNPQFRVSFRGWQGSIPETEVLWFCDPDPWNPYARGSGTAGALGDELETDEFAAQHTRQWFYNRARPDLVISAKGLKPEDTKRLEEDWLSKNQGFWKAFKPYFMSGEVQVHELDQDFRSQQFVQLREHERNTIVQVFGVPPELLGVLEHSNRATVEAAGFLFSRWVLVPRLEFMRAVLQERLVPEFDEKLILDYVSPVQEDNDYQLQVGQAAPFSARVDEWRARQGLPPLDNNEGQVFVIPSLSKVVTSLADEAQASADSAAAALDLLKNPPPPPPVAPGEKPPAGAETPPKAEDKPPAKKPLADEGKKRAARYRATKADELDGLLKIADMLRPRMRRAFLESFLKLQQSIAVEQLQRLIESGASSAAIEQVVNYEMLRQALVERVTPILREGLLQGGEFAARSLREFGVDITFDMKNPSAINWASEYGATLIKGVNEATRDAVRDIIATALDEGMAPDVSAKLIRDIVGLTSRQARSVERFRANLEEQGISASQIEARTEKYAESQLKYRAMNIARTETMEAANVGQQELWNQAVDQGILDPTETQRMWIVTDDDRLDASVCEPMDGQEVGMDEPFQTGEGDEVMVPPAHPQCRCAVGLTFKSPPKKRVVTAPALAGSNGHR